MRVSDSEPVDPLQVYTLDEIAARARRSRRSVWNDARLDESCPLYGRMAGKPLRCEAVTLQRYLAWLCSPDHQVAAPKKPKKSKAAG
jgi:hypothetical protein